MCEQLLTVCMCVGWKVRCAMCKDTVSELCYVWSWCGDNRCSLTLPMTAFLPAQRTAVIHSVLLFSRGLFMSLWRVRVYLYVWEYFCTDSPLGLHKHMCFYISLWTPPESVCIPSFIHERIRESWMQVCLSGFSMFLRVICMCAWFLICVLESVNPHLCRLVNLPLL